MKPNFTQQGKHSAFSTATLTKQLSIAFSFILIVFSSVGYAGNSPLSTESMRTNLYLLNTTNNSTILADGILTEYNNMYHDSVMIEDAYKFTNIKENLGSLRYGSTLAIERRPIIGMADTTYLRLWKTTQRSYQVEFIPISLNHPGLTAFLLDNYLGTSTPVSLTDTTRINFVVNSNTASSSASRFRLIYKSEASFGTLPVTFTSIKGFGTDKSINVEWKVDNEISIRNYEAQHSTDGINFTSFATKTPTDKISNTYTVTDNDVKAGNNFYRVKSVDLDGKFKYSSIVKVTTGRTMGGAVSLYPNPVKGGSFNLQFTNKDKGTYAVRLLNSNGAVVYTTKLQLTTANSTQSIQLTQQLAAGVYQLQVIEPNNAIQNIKAIVQ